MSLSLKPVEIKELIARYESELRKMSFQRQMVVNAITELENMLGLPNSVKNYAAPQHSVTFSNVPLQPQNCAHRGRLGVPVQCHHIEICHDR